MSDYPLASYYLGEILHLYGKIDDLQHTINELAEKAKKSLDYEEYKESINSYTTFEG